MYSKIFVYLSFKKNGIRYFPAKGSQKRRCLYYDIVIFNAKYLKVLTSFMSTMMRRNECMLGLATILYVISSISILAKVCIWLGIWLATGGYYWCYLAYYTGCRDLR